MYKKTYVKIKLLLFLVVFLFLFVIYCVTMPIGDVHYGEYTFHFFNMTLLFITMISILILELQSYSKKDWVIAGLLGLLSIGITISVNVTGVINGICVFFTYLASKTLYGEYSTRMELFNAKNVQEFLEDLKWMFIVSGYFILIKFIKVYKIHRSFQFYLHWDALFQALGASISEEIVFRLFLFAVVVHISKGDVKLSFLAILIMVLPFSLFHFVEVGIYEGILEAFINGMNLCIVSIALTFLALKRNVFTAIGAHFLIDFISFVFFK